MSGVISLRQDAGLIPFLEENHLSVPLGWVVPRNMDFHGFHGFPIQNLQFILIPRPPAEAFTFLAPENSSEDVVASSATRKTPVLLDDVMDIIGVSWENMGKS